MATLEASRDKEYRHNKFMAALKGIDLDAEKKREQMERVIAEMERIEAEREGREVDAAPKKDDFSMFGIALVEEGEE